MGSETALGSSERQEVDRLAARQRRPVCASAGLPCSDSRSANVGPRGVVGEERERRESTASFAWREAASSAMPCSGMHAV
jgi:hypothetical protein